MKKSILVLIMMVNLNAVAATKGAVQGPVSTEVCYGSITFIGNPSIGVDGAAIKKHMENWYRLTTFDVGFVEWGLRYFVKTERLKGVENTGNADLEFDLNDMAKGDVGRSVRRVVELQGCYEQPLH
ncbi:MAG: hypothetical protein ACXWQE_12260 [Bdellovibrionales bacterium]